MAGNCRMCLVEIEKSPKPVPGCISPVIDGMESYTKTPLVHYNSIFTSAVSKKKPNVRFFHSTSVCLMKRAARQIVENAGHSVPERVPKGSCSFIPGISSCVMQNSPKCPFLMEHQLPPKYSFSNYPIDLENLNPDGKPSSSSGDSSGGGHSSSNSEEAWKSFKTNMTSTVGVITVGVVFVRCGCSGCCFCHCVCGC